MIRLERWSEYWCFSLNPSQCEPSFFSVDSHQANLQPDLFLFNSRLRFNPILTFLGVTFDCTLSIFKMFLCGRPNFPRLKALRCISAFSCGPSKESLSLLYKPFLRPLLTYTSPAWFPFLSVTNITEWERLHQAASRAISGCLSSFPIPLFLSDASLPPRVTQTHSALSSFEQALRLPTSFTISGLVRLGVKQDSVDRFGELLRPLTRSCFLLFLLGRLSLLDVLHFLGTCLSFLWSPPLPLMLPL